MWLRDIRLFWVLLLICHSKTFYAKCVGRSEINGVLNGTIDILGYPVNTHCQWLIRAPLFGQRVKLIFQEFETECSYDYLKVYDGNSTSAKLLATLSGNTSVPMLLSSSSAMLLDFFSDNNYSLKGWKVDFEIGNCPGGCNGNGSCVGNTCNCDEFHTGDTCGIEICPQMCNISGHGECSKLNGECACNAEYVGESCSLNLHDDSDVGSWHVIKRNSDVFRARFGHAGQYVKENNALWIFGGSDLNMLFDDLMKFDFIKNKWFLINSTGPRPAARFRHTLVTYKDTLILFGGQVANGTFVNDIWSFNISKSEWKILTRNGDGSPPGLASHTANVIGDKLFVLGGRSQEHAFSHDMYTYDLNRVKGWVKVVYKLGKKSDLRLVGHSSVYYPYLRSLVVFGGFQRSYKIEKTNAIHMYNVEYKIWMKVGDVSSHASYLPEPRAYHSAVVVGNYMVVYGGNVHKHFSDETCYENKLHLFNLKSFTWVSPSLLTAIGHHINPSWKPQRGRFSSVAPVLNESTILVSGGFSGISHGDLLAYKLPINVATDRENISAIPAKYCSLYDKHSCGLDPSCVWCNKNSNCLSVYQSNTCSELTSSVVPQICSVFVQCISCLVWGSQPDLACGWCVQDSRCYPRGSPSGMCARENTIRGWWGDSSSFLTLLDQCRTKDIPPGLVVNVHFNKKIRFVSIMNPLRKTFNPVPPRFSKLSYYSVRIFGFIYPYFSTPINNKVDIKLRVSRMSTSLRLSPDDDPSNTVKVISFNNQNDDDLKIARIINTSFVMFPNASVNKMYYMEIKSDILVEARNAKLEVFINGMLLNGSHVRPFFSSDCSVYTSCLKCLSDASCGWYSNNNTCTRRDNAAFSYSGEAAYLTINATFCDTCTQYIDCVSCMNDSNCKWNGLFCDLLGKDQSCLAPCNSNKNCGSCVQDKKCFWCENKRQCILRFSYVPDYLHGQCSHWSNSNTKNGQCRDCSMRKSCADCINESYCGWCGEYHNGRCFDGGYDGPNNGQCNQLMASNDSNSSLWSYTGCPDENECITKKPCHPNATCTNTIGGYTCKCRIGYEGDGIHCHVSCNPPCVQGKCNSVLTCDCDLGWTSNNCSEDCGCNSHSTCRTGIGVCDKCQEFTSGEHCDFCLAGSYGNATTSLGCTECQCNGHGDEHRGICDVKTGDCFCLNNTMGKHCNQCLPGLLGHPEHGGGCYHPCVPHSIVSNVIHGAVSTSVGSGADNKENTNCVWIITTSRNERGHIVYTRKAVTVTITLRIKDLDVDCQTDHVYVYDGFPDKIEALPAFLDSSFNLIGSICGLDASNVPTIESRTGTLVVVFKGNLGRRSSTKGFNATFVINRCPDVCTGNRYCLNNGTHQECVCKAGWTGRGCDHVICPANCSEKLGNGYCDQNLRSCVCSEGFAGESCNVRNPFNKFIWKSVFNVIKRSSGLARMGHTVVADVVNKSLIIYGGYSFHHGILTDTWIYDITKRNYVRVQDGSKGPTARYLHAAAVYKRHMYISGGIIAQGFSSELWKFNLDSRQWTKAQSLPSRVAGHTLNIVHNTLYLIGGYDPDSYCSTQVYVLGLDSNLPWTHLSTTGDTFNACFGHTTVYDKNTKSLIVFGKDATQIISGSDSTTLAILHLTTDKWTVEPELAQSYLRYFHLSMVVGDVMIVSGGYTGSGRFQDFADIPLVYNIQCKQWGKLDGKGVFSQGLAHSSSAAVNDEIYIFGGYNGIASDKLYRLNISSDWCSVFSTKDECVGIGGCEWCFANATNQSFCFNYKITSPHNCSSGVVPGNKCSLNRVTALLKNAITSSLDICTQNSLSENCSSCIMATDKNGKSASCFWVVNSRRCLPAYFTPILCLFGLCGRMLREYDVCPSRCHHTQYCHDCLELYNCGWCADPRGNGKGTCMEGTIKGSLNGTCQSERSNLPGLPITAPMWISSVCLLEDECQNKHHQCNENETCSNLETRYECLCKSGYIRQRNICVPVCRQGCVKGVCVAPDTCRCHFASVGSNCSTTCKCNGMGNCLDENQLDNCTDCRNNTTGRSCERCLPGFIGQDGVCNPCSQKCNKNAIECYSKEDHTKLLSNSVDKERILYGPRDDGTHICICIDNSKGKHCDTCEIGYFKGQYLKCESCQCRGHASKCVADTGLGCDCKNNTKTPPHCQTTVMTIPTKCPYQQCSQCESHFVGAPEQEGQQCYRTMTLLHHFSITRDNSEPPRLLPGQTNFFYVHPSYTNADIRLTFDVFNGFIDVYVATKLDVFNVEFNQSVSISSAKISPLEIYSDGLNKYVTFSGDSVVAVIKEVHHRLVVTFPFEEHQLADQQFFVVVKAGFSGADGITYFKQDNVKIDLVVFFAVFFSCFFLILSVIVIGWSIKHHIHSRQQVHNREVLSERLQSRPFAKFSFLFEYQAPSPSMLRHRKTTGSTRKAIRAMGVRATHDYLAAISTVMIQMPQTEKTKMSIMLGTTLTTMNPNHLDRLSSRTNKGAQEMETGAL